MIPLAFFGKGEKHYAFRFGVARLDDDKEWHLDRMKVPKVLLDFVRWLKFLWLVVLCAGETRERRDFRVWVRVAKQTSLLPGLETYVDAW